MKKIITIAREYGAGGSAIGRRVAHELGIPFYDRDIILKTALASGYLDPAQVRQYDEKIPANFGLGQSLFDFYGRPLSEALWDAQVKAIRETADKESCVIVGRNADYILREFDHCLRVFVHAGTEWRVAHMLSIHPESTEEQVRGDMKYADRARRSYCTHYTGQTYGLACNYDMTLCTSKLGIDRCVSLVLSACQDL